MAGLKRGHLHAATRIDGLLSEDTNRPSMGTSIAWATAGAIGRQLIGFAGIVVLARLLTPQAYGLAAIVSSLALFTAILTEGGVGSALISAPRLSAEVFASGFYLNVALSLIAGALMLALAWPFGAWYDSSQLTSMIVVVAGGMMCSWGVAHLALLERAKRYRKVAVLEMAATLAGQAAAVIGALFGLGAMSLAIAPAITLFVSGGLYILGVGQVPRWRFVRTEVRPIVQFGSAVLGSNLIYYGARNVDNFLIGGFVGRYELGIYSRAYALMMLPLQQITMVVARVLLPYLSRDRERIPQFAFRWRMTVRGSLLMGVPLTVTMIFGSGEIVALLLGPKWSQVSSLFSILALAIPPQMVSTTVGPVYQSLGRPRRQLVFGLLNTVLTILAMVGGLLANGTHGLAVGVVCGYYFACLVAAIDLSRLLDLRVHTLLYDQAALVLPLLAQVSVCLAGEMLVGGSGLVRLTVIAIGGVLVYVSVLLLMDRSLRSAVFSRDLQGVVRAVLKLGAESRYLGDPAAPSVVSTEVTAGRAHTRRPCRRSPADGD